MIKDFGRLFKRAVGSPADLAEEARARDQHYMHGPKKTAFVSD